jgi:hypothetical protein
MEKRQICWAHLIRKFASFAESSGPIRELGTQLLFWSQAMMHYWHMVREGSMSGRRCRRVMISVQPIVEGLLVRGVSLKARGLSGSCQDILDHKLAMWTFISHEGIEPTRFDNLKVETVAGAPAYYTEMLDDLELTDLSTTPVTKLVYGGSWSHENGKGMFNYQRSLSTSQGAGATLKYTFTGTGLDVLGPNNGTAKLEVTVDGQVMTASAPTLVAKELYQAFALRGLAAGMHTVQLKVVSGTLVVDAVGVIPAGN